MGTSRAPAPVLGQFSPQLPHPGAARRRGLAGVLRLPAAQRISCALAAGCVVLAAASTAIVIADGDLVLLTVLPGILGCAGMGAVVAWRRPGHRMGLLLAAMALTGAFCQATLAYGRAAVVLDPAGLPGGQLAMWLTTWDFIPPGFLTAIALPLLFPDGALPSRRWRPVAWVAGAFLALSLAGNAFAPLSMGRWFDDLPNPCAVGGPAFLVVLDASYACGLVALLAAVASVVTRWRRAGRVMRQQLKWYLAAVPLLIACAVAGQFLYSDRALVMCLAVLAGTTMSAAIGLGVLRYKLYEIDVFLSRAVAYGLASAVVAGLFLAMLALSAIASGASAGLAGQVTATLLAAAVLLPLHGRLQRRVDRVFFGDRGAPYAAIARLGRKIEDAAPAEPVLSSVASIVAGVLRLPYAAVELRVADGWLPGASWGAPTPSVAAFPLVFQRETVGRLVAGQRSARERLSAGDEQLLAALAAQIAPAAHAVALREALDASRSGLVTAREEERRRLRRDLHDGLGPALAGLTLGLDAALALDGDDPRLPALLASLKAETQQAADDVRRIARGLRPPTLDELGLGGALREQVLRLSRDARGLAVTLEVPAALGGQVPAAVEVAAYRIVTEALTNVLRHAGARHCQVTVAAGDAAGGGHGWLQVEVADDGAGLPDGWQAGVGITAMRERVAELGGELAIDPAAPHGTRIAARLPVPAAAGSAR